MYYVFDCRGVYSSMYAGKKLNSGGKEKYLLLKEKGKIVVEYTPLIGCNL